MQSNHPQRKQKNNDLLIIGSHGAEASAVRRDLNMFHSTALIHSPHQGQWFLLRWKDKEQEDRHVSVNVLENEDTKG